MEGTLVNQNFAEFRRGVISPMECIKEGWGLIRDQYWLYFGISIVGILVGGLVPIVLMGPMMVGIFMCFQQRQRNQPVEFGTVFNGFGLFVQGLVVTVLKMIPVLVLLIPYYVLLFGMMAATMPREEHPSPEAMQQFFFSFFGFEMLFFVTIMTVSILIEIFFMLAYPLVADRRISGLDAIKLSFRASKANFGGILGLMLLNALFGFVGVLCCFVGVYFYLPVAFASQAVAYRRIFPDLGSPLPSPPPPPGNWA
jgi:tetrahydromethanopterin S-methyltransferase subunit F